MSRHAPPIMKKKTAAKVILECLTFHIAPLEGDILSHFSRFGIAKDEHVKSKKLAFGSERAFGVGKQRLDPG
jgi:hypothetical protein